MVRKKTPEDFDAELAAVNDQVIRVGPYKGKKYKLLC